MLHTVTGHLDRVLALAKRNSSALLFWPQKTYQPAQASVSPAESEQPLLQEEWRILYFILCVLGRGNVSVTLYIKPKPI